MLIISDLHLPFFSSISDFLLSNERSKPECYMQMWSTISGDLRHYLFFAKLQSFVSSLLIVIGPYISRPRDKNSSWELWLVKIVKIESHITFLWAYSYNSSTSTLSTQTTFPPWNGGLSIVFTVYSRSSGLKSVPAWFCLSDYSNKPSCPLHPFLTVCITYSCI